MWQFIIGFILGIFASWIYCLLKSRKSEPDPKTIQLSSSIHDVDPSDAKPDTIQIPIVAELSEPKADEAPAPIWSKDDEPSDTLEETETSLIVPDDLKKIKGIGPKINGLMEKAGIVTFEQLANAELDVLEAILDEAGPRFRLADPDDWAKQARELMT